MKESAGETQILLGKKDLKLVSANACTHLHFAVNLNGNRMNISPNTSLDKLFILLIEEEEEEEEYFTDG